VKTKREEGTITPIFSDKEFPTRRKND